MSALPDHAAEQDDRDLDIDKVGIKGLAYPISVWDRRNENQHTVADVNLYVALPREFKGTHMSRFVEILDSHRGEMTLRNIPRVLSAIQRRLEAQVAHLEVSFPYFVAKKAPVSGVESLMNYKCTFRAAKDGDELDFVLAVQVPVKTLCPCSKAVSDYGAHNQRSLVDVEVRSSSFIWIEDVIDVVEGCASAPLYALLKREDEKYVTEQAYDNPKFVEDLVRDVVLGLRKLEGVSWIRVQTENRESIHNHSAYAEIEWPSPAAASAGPRPGMARTELAEPRSFGAWLKGRRLARHLNQEQLATQLGISAEHLSRVESDARRLSADRLIALSEALGLDPITVQLRAGVVPEHMLEAIAADPEGFRAWSAR